MSASELMALCLASVTTVTPHTLWWSWSFAPATLGPLVLAAIACLFAGRDPSRGGFRVSMRWSSTDRILCLAGLGLLAVALVSPLCRLAAVLASAHMAQHVLITVVAAPVLALGLERAIPRRLRRWLRRVDLATVAFGAMIWLAHAPLVYQAALTSTWAHLLVLWLILGSALWFWLAAFAARWDRALLSILATVMHTGILGALLTFASQPWYPVFGIGPSIWGLSPLADQQLAGLIMWVPMGAILTLAGVILAARRLLPAASRG